MRLVLFLLFSFFTLLAAAQTTDPLPWLVNRHCYFARYAEAQTAVDKALQTRLSRPESKEYAVALSMAGYMDWIYGRYGKADTALATATAIFERIQTTADSNYLKNLSWQVGVCRDLGQYVKAKEIIQKGLAASEQCQNTPHEAYKAGLLEQFAGYNEDLCQFSDAKLQYQRLLEVREKQYGKKHVKWAMAITQYATFLKGKLSDYTKAESLLLKAKKILEPLAAKYPKEYAEVLSELSDIYGFGIPRQQVSQQLLDEAIALVKQYLGEQHPVYAGLLRTLASNYIYQTPWFFKADTLHRQALAIYTHHFGEFYPYRVGAMQDIASWYGQLGRNKDATRQRKEAYALCLRILGEDHVSTASLMLSVASDLQNEGKRLEADTLIDKALTIYKTKVGTFHTGYINALEAKSDLWKWQGRYSQADSLLLDIQRRQGELFGRNSPEWFNSMKDLISFDVFYAKRLRCDSLIRLSEVYYRKKGWEHTATFWNLLNTKIYFLRYEKRYPEAQLVADELIRLVETTFGKDNFWYLSMLRSQIDIKSKLKDFATVERLLAEYEKISLKIYGPVSGSRMNYLNELESFYQFTKSESDLLSLHEEQVELEEKLGGSGSLYCMNLCQLAASYSTFGRYEASRKVIEKARDYALSSFGVMDDDYVFLLWTIEQAYFNMEDYDAAFATMQDFKKVLIGLKAFDGDYKKAYLFSSGKIENERGNYQEAEKYFKEWGTMESALSDFGYYNLYGGLLCDMNRYAESDSMYKIGLAIQEKAQDDRDFFYNNMAINQMKWGNYTLELQYAELSLKEARRRLGEDNPNFATNIGNYATALCNMDQLVAAEGYYLEAIKLIEKTKGRNNADFALKLNNYGVFLWQVGRMQEAKDALQESLNIYATKSNPELPDRYTTLGNLKQYYQDIGQLKEAEELSHQIIGFWKARAPKSADYGAALNGYGQFCRSIGENEKAVAIFSEMKDIYAHIFGANSPRVAEALAQIGKTQIIAKQYDAAIQTYQQCRVMDSLNVGTEHSLYSFDLHSLGNCYFLQGNYPEAEKYLLRSNQIKAKIFKNPVKAIGETYNILAAVYEAQNRLPEAETACRKAIDVLLAAAGEKNEDYLEARQRLGNILAAQHREPEAKVELLASYGGYRSKIRGAFSYFSTVQQQSLIAKYNLLEFCPTFQMNTPPAFWGAIAYDNALLLKGVALQNSRTLREQLASDSLLTEPYKAWLDALNNIYAQYRLRIGERDNLDSLQQIADGLEKQLAQRSSDYKTYLKSFDTRWQDVQQKLNPHEAAIEFIRFNRKKAGGPDDYWYAALVLRPDGKEPQFVTLCAEMDLPQILQDNKKRDPDAVAGIYNIPVGTTRGGGGARPVQESLYVNIWQPIEKWLEGVTHVYFSPDGLLHRVNFGALGFNDAQGREVRLLKLYTLTQLGSTRELSALEAPISTNGGQVLYAGNIDYGMPQRSVKGSTRAGFNPLDKSEEKMGNTAAIVTKNNIPLQKIAGKDATETKVLQLLSAPKSPKAVLFDTHGFFLPEPIGSKEDTTLAHLYWERNPMMQSGLVFANVNESLAKGREAETESDGVLTALDFAKTNLKGTEVVILPVCNSALGKIQSTEGVFGLQRAFKQAGAKYVLMSLWEVPDDAAVQSFTDEFLRQWLENHLSIPEAFHTTQQKKYEDKTSIRTWGAMILIE